MKKINFIIIITFNFLVFSQSTIEKPIGEFSKLKVFSFVNVELIKSTENKVEISGKESRNVSITQENNTLKIRMSLDKYLSGNDVLVKLYYIKINSIEVYGGAKVASPQIIKQYELELKAKEGGEIKTEVDTNVLTVKSVTGGKVQAYGTTKSQNIKINTGGIYMGQNLKAESSKVEIKAGGKADVKSNDFTGVKILAGGVLTIHGTTKELKQSTIIGGKIYYK
jgi:hypothetical protein